MRVCSVDAQMDEHDIPFDVIWLDIEYTDGKRYFTWDTNKFPKPQEMLDALVAKGRNLVTIIDPHLKADTGYAVYREARDRDLLVKTKDRQNFEGSFSSIATQFASLSVIRVLCITRSVSTCSIRYIAVH